MKWNTVPEKLEYKKLTYLVTALKSATTSVRLNENLFPLITGTLSHLSEEKRIFKAVPMPVV